jgi:hypothetical protein
MAKLPLPLKVCPELQALILLVRLGSAHPHSAPSRNGKAKKMCSTAPSAAKVKIRLALTACALLAGAARAVAPSQAAS